MSSQHRSLAYLFGTALAAAAACKSETPATRAPQGQQPPAAVVNPASGDQQLSNNKPPEVGSIVASNQPVTLQPGKTFSGKFHARDNDSGDSIAKITFTTEPPGIIPVQELVPNAAGTEQSYLITIPAQPSAQAAIGKFVVCDTHSACTEAKFAILFSAAPEQNGVNTGPSATNAFCNAMIPVLSGATQGQSTPQDSGNQLTTTLMTLGCQLIK